MNDHGFLDLKDTLMTYLSTDEVATIERAYNFSNKAHSGQLRKSGDPYIIHPVAVAKILAKLQQDTSSIVAGLLHDTLEDCDVSKSDVILAFGEDVADLVDGVTKLSKLEYCTKLEMQAENYRKMLVATAQDIRVIVIKLADRLHNMRTLSHMPPHKQQLKSKETMEIFAPLAHRLGVASVKAELEDLAFKYLEPEEFLNMSDLVTLKQEERETYLHRVVEDIQDIFEKHRIEASVVGRAKHVYSIYKKMKTNQIPFDELYDTLGVRVLVEDIGDCYSVLGLLHSMYKPISGRFKDYIAMPKSNKYQSLHTTVIGPLGKFVEFQIRTVEMHQIAEYGVAAHWNYKEGKHKPEIDKDFAWLREVLDASSDDDNAKNFISDLKGDLFTEEIFVFTPKGEVKVMSLGATAIDFAYAVHTEVGHTCIGAKANGQIVPLDHELKNGDMVTVMTSKKSVPNLDWLQFVRSRHARTKIKAWFKRQNRADNLEKGRSKLERVLMVEGYELKTLLTKVDPAACLERYNIDSLDELYLKIVEGDVSAKEVAKLLFEGLPPQERPKAPEPALPTPKTSRAKSDVTIISVLGEKNVMVTLAKCCSPLPGDDIEGIVSIGKGISVHRSDCPNLLSLSDDKKGRLVPVAWDTYQTGKAYFSATLHIEGFDRMGILQDVVHTITDKGVNMTEISSHLLDDSRMRAIVHVEVHSTKQLSVLSLGLRQIPDVYSVVRVSNV